MKYIPGSGFMDAADAFQVVLDLAKQNALDPETCDAELTAEAERQATAINVITDIAVNEYGDD